MTEPLSVFRWSELATDAVCARLATLAGVTGPVTPQLRQLVAHTSSHVGGLPVLRGAPTPAQLEELVFGLLHEAFRHTLASLNVEVERRGFVSTNGTLAAVRRVCVNTADARGLEPLPAIGPRTADAIVEERLTRGPFSSFAELADRIRGIGTNDGEALEGRVSYARPETPVLAYDHLGFDDCFRALLATAGPSASAEATLMRALETVASCCARAPHPATREKRVREWTRRDEGAARPVDEVQLMTGGSYYQGVQDAIAAATESISVAMFHVALPAERHPTRAILDALGQAQARGVRVRVLVDRDQPSDPYQSEVINKPALEYLRARNVECRSDETRKLLHSKLVVIDRRRVLLGSHNWSAGSYFQFDDTSVLIDSEAFAGIVLDRFESLWDKAELEI